MKNNTPKLLLTSLAVTGIFQALPAYAAGSEEEIVNEVSRQVTRQISQSISRRVSATAAAPAEEKSNREGNFWLNPQYTDIATSGNGISSSTSLYALLFGGDTQVMDKLFVGASANYTRGESVSKVPGLAAIGGAGKTWFFSNSWSVSPYAAYKFNENFFVNGILGYSGMYQDDSNFRSDTFLSDISLNGVLPMGSLGLSGKVGYRGNYTVISPASAFGGASDNFYSQTVYVTGEIGYKINDFRPYFNASWEHIVPEQDHPAGGTAPSDIDQVYSTVGVDYTIKKSMTAGLYYTRELTQNTYASGFVTDYNAAGANLKLKF